MPDDPRLRVALSEGPFHAALRAAVEARGLTLERLRRGLEERGLRVGMTSLSYWQQGLRRPERPESLRAVRGLEEILALPPRSLMGLLGPPRPRGRGQGTRSPEDDGWPAVPPAGSAHTLSALLHDLDGVADDRRLHVTAMYETLQIGADRSATRRETLQVVRARRDDPDRFIMVYRGDLGCDVERVRIRALEDCRVGRIRRDGATALVVAELLFGRALEAGETQVIRYELADPSGVETTEYERIFRLPADQYVLRVAFSPVALPGRVRRFTCHTPDRGEREPGAHRSGERGPDDHVLDDHGPGEHGLDAHVSASDGYERVETELTLNAHHAAHLVTGPFGPGAVGVRWDWP
ncbi:hypothetical protein AB0D67_28360 [Streptosporangium sp. NPDC048047]|uniref:hypothetical protein n=1 Tax=Streptosporangium sp. NPDC048047 TaxID=3155748 RepID=UPI00341751F6